MHFNLEESKTADQLLALGTHTAHLFCHLMLNILLYPPEHEGLEDEVESGELVLVHDRFLLCMALNVSREPLVELLVRVKHAGHDEVKQGPQLERSKVSVASLHWAALLVYIIPPAWYSGWEFLSVKVCFDS